MGVTRYVQAALRRRRGRSSSYSPCEHIGFIDHEYGDGSAWVQALCGERGSFTLPPWPRSVYDVRAPDPGRPLLCRTCWRRYQALD